jgi:hypothetical protein
VVVVASCEKVAGNARGPGVSRTARDRQRAAPLLTHQRVSTPLLLLMPHIGIDAGTQ